MGAVSVTVCRGKGESQGPEVVPVGKAVAVRGLSPSPLLSVQATAVSWTAAAASKVLSPLLPSYPVIWSPPGELNNPFEPKSNCVTSLLKFFQQLPESQPSDLN